MLETRDEVSPVITETARLRLRKLTLEDAKFVLALVNDPSFIANIGDKGLQTREDAERFIREGPWTNQEKPGHGQFVVELKETNAPVGICGLLFREAVGFSDIGFAFLPGYRGKGFAFEAAESVLRYGRSTLGLTKIGGLTSPDNLASIRLLERLGMALETVTKMSGKDPGTAIYS